MKLTDTHTGDIPVLRGFLTAFVIGVISVIGGVLAWHHATKPPGYPMTTGATHHFNANDNGLLVVVPHGHRIILHLPMECRVGAVSTGGPSGGFIDIAGMQPEPTYFNPNACRYIISVLGDGVIEGFDENDKSTKRFRFKLWIKCANKTLDVTR